MLIENLIFGKFDTTHFSLRISGSESSNGPDEVSLVQDVERARVAVEQRADGAVAVEVDAPVVAVADVAARLAEHAVVRHVAALGAEVVERVVTAVRVHRRQDEDVEVVDVGLGGGIGRVVAHEPLGRLQARDRGDPLTRVLLAVDEHAGLGAVADRAACRCAGRAGRTGRALDVRRAVVRELTMCHSSQLTRATHRDDARARVAVVQVRRHERARARVGVDRVADLRGRARRRAFGALRRASDTVIGALPSGSLPSITVDSGEPGGPGPRTRP